jgi:teichuronic acid biosynthesis glycosyltransferase TuaG
MHQPVVSVIMAAFNAATYIKESIQSVIDQTYKNWELLIVNDGSKDKTEEIINSFHDSRIKYFWQENKGVSSARNVGLQHMSASYFCFLDADDILPKDSLEKRVMAMEARQSVDVLDCKVAVKDSTMTKDITMYTPSYEGQWFQGLLKFDGSCYFGPNLFFKKVEGLEIRFKTDLSHGEDLLFCIELAIKHNTRYSWLNEVCYHYRRTSNSAMSNLKGLEKGYEKIIAYINGSREISFTRKLIITLKVRKIMLFSYLGNGAYKDAFRYCLANISKR